MMKSQPIHIEVLPHTVEFIIVDKDINGCWINISKYLTDMIAKLSDKFGGAFLYQGTGLYINFKKDIMCENNYILSVSFSDKKLSVIYKILTDFICELSFDLIQETVAFKVNGKQCFVNLPQCSDYERIFQEVIDQVNKILFGVDIVNISKIVKSKERKIK